MGKILYRNPGGSVDPRCPFLGAPMLVVKCRETDVSHSCVVGGSSDAAFGCQYCSKLLSIEDIDKAQDVAATVGRNGCSI